MRGTRLRVRPIHLASTAILGIMLCITLTDLPSRAAYVDYFNQNPANWHDNHQNFAVRCAAQADSQGRWGRQRQWDTWCKENLRFRPAQPDQQWRHDHPWDHGNSSDHGGNTH